MSSDIDSALSAMAAETAASKEWVARLADNDFFVLDNSIRESTVGQLRGHTIENKKAIFEVSKSLNVPGIIVASFSYMHRVDDEFCAWLRDSGADFSRLWSFSDVLAGPVVDGVPSVDVLPPALPKNKKYGLYNTVFEVDLADPAIGWDGAWGTADMCALLERRMQFVYDEINPDANILISLRDMPAAMATTPRRVLDVIAHLAQLPEKTRPTGIAFEDPLGESLPREMAAWTRAVRSVMDAHGWTGARLLNHIHEKWDLQTATTLECLAAGSDGVWASVCCEGAAMGHASSTVTLTNLIRLGNKKVTQEMKCRKFRQAAIDVTRCTTGVDPHPKQVVYGKRAVDLVFGFLGVGDFNIGDYFGERTTNRITTLASGAMIKDRLEHLFGKHEQFTEEMGETMREKMLEDLNAVPPRKEEYHSAMGLAVLFDRCGGQLTAAMADAIGKVELSGTHHQAIMDEIRSEWDNWDARDEVQGDDMLEFDSFYHGFLRPYFGCYRCLDTRKALCAIDMDGNGQVDWKEFEVYIKWALHQYPEMSNADEVLEVAFTKGLIPASYDVSIAEAEK